MIEDQEDKQIKAIGEHEKQLAESNALVKRDDNSKNNSKLLLKQKNIYDKLDAKMKK